MSDSAIRSVDAESPRMRHATVVVLALHISSLIALCWQQKLTTDEGNYVLAGCILRHELSWDAHNTVLHGPLAFWPNQLGVLFADPADLPRYIPWGRLGYVPFTVLAAVALLRLARRAFGARVALLAAVLWATNPLVLAHGCLVTADMALTCTSLWTLERAWRWLSAPNWPRLLHVGVALGLALATKYLALLLLPALGLTLLFALARGLRPSLLWSRRRTSFAARGADAALAVVSVAFVAWLALHSAYLWRVPGYRANPPPAGVRAAPEDGRYGPHSEGLRAVAESSPGRIALRLLPAPFVRGVDFQKQVSEGLPTFFGDRVAPGFWIYYVVAFGTKLPLLMLALMLLGALVRRPEWPRHLPAVAVFGAGVPLLFLSGITTLQIGVRYALPAVPFLCLLGARGWNVLAASRARPLRHLALACGIALVALAAHTWPRFLTSFNRLAPRPYLWFKDSTLDWRAGSQQDDGDLRTLLARHPGAQVINGATGPRFGRLIVHGEQLAPRDPRDDGRIYHWLRRFQPIDHVGAWFAFVVDRATFAAAVASDRDHRERGRMEQAMAVLGEGAQAEALALLQDCTDADVARVRAARDHLASDDPVRVGQALLDLGRPDLVLQRGDSLPRELRARALVLSARFGEVVELLSPAGTALTGTEPYLLATALSSTGRGRDAIEVLERHPSVDPAAADLHARILARLRETVEAQDRANAGYLRR